ncbi:NB-ARC domain-containing protein [Streptomyces sp. NPDC002476]|uniref:NB-ARC domain-containing protein n=1 Tax=Streptomyces sp. NPDC002476 TaxID=3364648 RepID=UPI0036C3BEF3
MADPMEILPLKTLVTHSSAVLLTRGVEVEATSVRGVAAHLVETMAQQTGMDLEEAFHLVTPEAVAEITMQAAAGACATGRSREGESGISGGCVRDAPGARLSKPLRSLYGGVLVGLDHEAKYEGGSVEAELAALAASGASALVGAMVTDSWEQAKTRVARLFARRGRAREEEADDDLQEAGAQLVAAEEADDDSAAADIEAYWRLRLSRLLEEDPAAADELRQLLADLGGDRGQGGAAISGGVQYGAFQNSQIHGGITYNVQPLLPSEALPDEVPALRVPFVNRTADLSRMDGMVSSEESGSSHVDVLVLGGTPGVGKSATASRWAHRSRERFPDGQLYVDFAELRGQNGGGDVSAAVAMCLRSLGVKDPYLPQSLAERTRLFRSRSAGRRILLVLDDVNEPAQVRALVPQGPGSAVLVTSNARLGELALDGARLLPLEPLDTHSALRILADRCGDQAVAAEPVAAERLVALCAGLPVALHVVAARLVTNRRLTMAGLADELSDESSRLTAMSLRGERSVSAVFDSTYRQLSADEARFYRLLGWLPCRTFDSGTAAAAAGVDTPTAQSLLDVLEEAGLLEVTDDDRYRFHDLVRLHARERAAAEEPSRTQRALVEKLVTHYLALTAFADRAVRADRLRIADVDGLLAGAADPFAADDAPLPLAWLEAERANILAVLREASRLGLHTAVWQLAEGFTVLFLHRRHLGDWRESLELGAAAAAASDELVPAAEARLRSLLSRPLMDLGEYEQARRELETAVACAEVADRTELRASVLEFFGRYWDRFDPSRAIEVYQRSLELNTEAGQKRGAAIASLFLGSAQDAAGDPAQALLTLGQARQALLAGENPDLRMAARAEVARGRAHDHLGDTEQAIGSLSEAARILREQKATHYEAEALLELAAIAERPGGDRTHLRSYLARALEIHEDGGSPLAEQLRERVRVLDAQTDPGSALREPPGQA